MFFEFTLQWCCKLFAWKKNRKLQILRIMIKYLDLIFAYKTYQKIN